MGAAERHDAFALALADVARALDRARGERSDLRGVTLDPVRVDTLLGLESRLEQLELAMNALVRAESPRVLGRRRFQPGAVVFEAVRRARETAIRRHVTLTIEGDSIANAIRADGEALAALLDLLLDLAIEAAGAFGRTTIRIRRTAPGLVEVVTGWLGGLGEIESSVGWAAALMAADRLGYRLALEHTGTFWEASLTIGRVRALDTAFA